MPSRLRATLVLTLLLAFPASAAANDQGVWNAYSSFPVSFDKAYDAWDKWGQRAGDSKLRDTHAVRRAMRADSRLRRVLGAIAKRVDHARPSSDDGKRGKVLVLRSLSTWRRGLALERAFFREFLAGHRRRAGRLIRRSAHQLKLSDRYDAQAHDAFRAAGIDVG
jgi:hypothetical protein